MRESAIICALKVSTAAILSVGLSHLDDWTARRRELGKKYLDKINNPHITMQAHPDNTKTVFHLFEVTVDKRDEFIEYMKHNGIGCDKHYPVPCHLQEAYNGTWNIRQATVLMQE